MLTLRAGQLEADVAPEAGMVVASLRAGGRELLGVRRGLEAYRAAGSTFGVPLLYPFANRLSAVRSERIDASAARIDGPTDLPIHGLPRARGPWTVAQAGVDRLVGVLDWDDPAFPPAHRVEVTYALDPDGLTVSTRVTGDGVPVAFGWHPYLAIDRATTVVAIPALRRRVLDERGLPTGEVEAAPEFAGPLVDRTYDDLFAAPPGTRFGAGDLEVAFEEGAPFAQVYAPADEQVIAFEPMTAPTNALVSGEDLATSPFVQRFRIGLLAA